MDSHPHAQGEGRLAVADGSAAVGVVGVGGDTELRVEAVEGPLGLCLPHWVGVVIDPVAMILLVGQVGVGLGPGPDLGVIGGQVGDSVTVAPVLWVELERLGGQLAVV
jgi:hypothetical protein